MQDKSCAGTSRGQGVESGLVQRVPSAWSQLARLLSLGNKHFLGSNCLIFELTPSARPALI